MAYSQRDPNATAGGIHPIPKAYAGVVLVALVGLIVLNRLFGSVTVTGGIK
jgi:hypothetical protein